MTGPSWFQRWLLPGFAFKAVVIGGGYATGRELAEFFLPSGPLGGLMAIGLAMLIWSLVCATTFVFAHVTGSEDYRTFFRNLLGPFWVAFEAAYVFFLVLILAVIGAAAGAIGKAVFGWPELAGAVALTGAVAAVVTFGTGAVERLFKYASLFLYAVYALFVLLAFGAFGDRIGEAFARATPTDGWVMGGVTYASYNLVCAVVILPVLRHLTSRRDAVVAGVLAGPLAMLPAALFFVCMAAFHPQVAGEPLPSDFLLRQMNQPLFAVAFQAMIFVALLETGVGAVHAMNERVAHVWTWRRGGEFPRRARLALAAALLVGSIFIADRFGLVALIAKGYRLLAWLFLALYVLPLMTYGVWRLATGRARRAATA